MLPDEARLRDRRDGNGGRLEQLQLMFLLLPDEARLRDRRDGDGGRPRAAAARAPGAGSSSQILLINTS